jgi:putative tricarboxylic transport membrane protein
MKQRVAVPLCVLIAAFGFLIFAAEARAAEYPEPGKTIDFNVHSQPGSGMDSFQRMAARFLNEEGIVKSKIQVMNRTGGASAVAINYTASKKGDPYILQQWTTSNIMAILRGTTSVKSVMDLTLIVSLVEDPNLLVVRPDSKYKSLKDLIDDARQNPNRVRGSVGSIGGTEHVIMNRLERATGVKFNITSFGGNAYIQVLGGHTDFTFSTMLDVQESMKAGKLKYLANAGEARAEAAPDIPTMKELGFNASMRQLRGFWGPPEMPDYAVKYWEQAFAKLMKVKGFQDFLKKIDMEPTFMGSEKLKEYMPAYYKEFAADVKDLDAFVEKK